MAGLYDALRAGERKFDYPDMIRLKHSTSDLAHS